MTVDSGFAPAKGAQIYYECEGRGEPLVLIHGNALDARMWDAVCPRLATHHRVIRYDMRGFGRSSPASTLPYAPSDDLRALLDHLGVERAHLLGFSLGGARAIDFALERPARVASLIAADAALDGFAWTEFADFMRGVFAAGRAQGREAAVARWRASALFTPARRDPDLSRRLDALVDDYSAWHWTGPSERLLHRHPMRAAERLHAIACPTLVIVGALDSPDFLAVAERLHQDIPGATRVILPGVGHLTPMEAPAAFTEAVLAFLHPLTRS